METSSIQGRIRTTSLTWQPWKTDQFTLEEHLDLANPSTETQKDSKIPSELPAYFTQLLSSAHELLANSWSSSSTSSISTHFPSEESDNDWASWILDVYDKTHSIDLTTNKHRIQDEPTDLSLKTVPLSNAAIPINLPLQHIPTPDVLLSTLKMAEHNRRAALSTAHVESLPNQLDVNWDTNGNWHCPHSRNVVPLSLPMSSQLSCCDYVKNEYISIMQHIPANVGEDAGETGDECSTWTASTPLGKRRFNSSMPWRSPSGPDISSPFSTASVTLTAFPTEYQTPPRYQRIQKRLSSSEIIASSFSIPISLNSSQLTGRISSNIDENYVTNSYTCKMCDKTYNQRSAFKMHLKTHTLPCHCEYCGKSFSRRWLLKGHERTHTGERPYKCSTCSRAFADRSNLRAHLQTHQTDRRYKCQLCQRSFSRIGLLQKHFNQSLLCKEKSSVLLR